MTVKVESFTAKVKRNLRVIVLISSHEKEMGAEKQRLSETESISSFSQIDTGWESVQDRLHAHIEKQRLAETEIYILDPMTAQLTHETRLTSIALSTTSFPIIWCAGHLPAQNNDGHMF